MLTEEQNGLTTLSAVSNLFNGRNNKFVVAFGATHCVREENSIGKLIVLRSSLLFQTYKNRFVSIYCLLRTTRFDFNPAVWRFDEVSPMNDQAKRALSCFLGIISIKCGFTCDFIRERDLTLDLII